MRNGTGSVMGRKIGIRGRAALLLAVFLLDGALLGSALGFVRYGGEKAREAGAAEKAREAGAADMGWSATRPPAGTKVTALTFDDGPHPDCTARLLDGLKERGVKATFFLMGQNIEGNEDLVLRMREEGHLIGNHSFRHVRLTQAGEDTVIREVRQTGDIIEGITGVRPRYLRPPFGDWNERLEDRIELTTVLWSLDSLDWKLQDTSRIVRRVEEQIRDGDIILMHDIFPTSVDAALELVDRLKEQGYSFVTVEELLIE